jgi:P-type Ca2+ transporter type 2C
MSYNKEWKEVINELNSDPEKGLTSQEASERLNKYGKNELKEKKKKSLISIIFSQLKEIMVIILIIAAVISILIHEDGLTDAIVIFIIVILNTTIGVVQESKAEKAMASLKKLSIPFTRVIRNGEIQEISSKKVVPGDIILIEAGNIIPADARLIECANLKVTESTLTGESAPVDKNPEVLTIKDPALGDRKNMIYSGTVASFGRGTAIVTETGMKTELGKIAGMLQDVEDEETPLQKKLNRLGASLSIAVLVLIAVVIGITFIQNPVFDNESIKYAFMTAISMAVAAIPEGLPAIVTIALALGAGRMLKRNALIRNLLSVETLGSVTVICSDKTGTLTQNKMTVVTLILNNKKIDIENYNKNSFLNENNLNSAFIAGGTLCNDATVDYSDRDNYKTIGDPTEGALVVAAVKSGMNKDLLEDNFPRIAELPFSSERKRMTTVHSISGSDSRYKAVTEIHGINTSGMIAFTKGSPDGLLTISDRVFFNNEITTLTDNIKESILKQNADLAKNGIRVLGLAYKPVSLNKNELKNITPENFEKDLIFLGLFGMIDPVRPEIAEAVKTCRQAGIRPIMITGDHPLTARYIAKSIGFTDNDKYVTGQELEKMTVLELKDIVSEISVYARVSPEHKMKLIDALQDRGQIVSMTGDGVNDAPALKSADIGVAMGITGTDVSKQASDMVLLDDNFTTIVKAVQEGRTIFENIRKFIRYILTGNMAEICIMLFGPVFGIPLPLLPTQILWINLVTDGAPAIAFGYEPGEKNLMKRPPYNPKESLFGGGIGPRILFTGTVLSILCILVGKIFYSPDNRIWQTMIFTTIAFSQMQFAYASRSNVKSIFKINLFTNIPMLFAIISTIALQLVIIYNPFFQDVFKTESLSPVQLGICFCAGFIVLLFIEIDKLIQKARTVK